jgi:DNA ligase-1
MLAYQWEKFEARISDDQRLFLSPKLDGIRCIVHCPEANRNESSGFTPRFVSRQGMELECGDHLAKYFSRMFRKDPNLVFDGELYSDLYKDDFEKITGAARCTRDRRTAEQQEIQENLQYYVFDLMHASTINKTTPFFERLSVLRRVLTEAKIPMTSNSSPIVLVPQLEATKSKIGSEFRRRRDEGYEGLMVRTAESPYMFGKRSPHILKVKEFADSEFKIVGVEEGEGRLKGHLGSFVCEADAPKPKAPTSPLNSKRSASKSSSKIVGEEPSEDTITFRATPKCPESRKREMWEQRDEFIGKMLTVTYQGLSTYGVPRFPIAKAIRGGQSKRDWL